MMLTDIIEVYKCFKSLSGATAAVNEQKIWKRGKKRKKRRRKREITTQRNIPQRAKCLKKKNCCGKALECYYSPPGKEKQTTLHSPNLRLPAASAQLHSLLWDPLQSQSTEKEKRSGSRKLKRIGERVRMRSLPLSELRSHLEKASASLDQSFIAVSRQPASHLTPRLSTSLFSDSIALWHYRPRKMPVIYWITQMLCL